MDISIRKPGTVRHSNRIWGGKNSFLGTFVNFSTLEIDCLFKTSYINS